MVGGGDTAEAVGGVRTFRSEAYRLRRRRGMTVAELAARANFDKSYLGRVLGGKRPPTQQVVERLDAALQADGVLLALAAADSLRDRLDTAAGESAAMSRLVRNDPVDGSTISELSAKVASIAQNYVSEPPLPLLHELLVVRDQIQHMLELGPRPATLRDLCLLGGVTVQLLGEVTDDISGSTAAALKHLRAAQHLAEDAGHPGLQAWIAGTRALVLEWSPRPHQALEILEAAVGRTPPGDHGVRLHALQARCAARVGDARLARAAASRAEEAADRVASDEVSAFGGVMTFPRAKAAYYLGRAFCRLGDHPQTERWATEAIASYSGGPAQQRSYGDESLARVDLCISRLGVGELEGAAEIIAPVLELSAEQRIAPIMEGMRSITATLQAHRHSDAPAAKDLAAAITAYTARPALALW
ncbi:MULTISPECIES: helix-turn-helix domain-containing protein [Nocardia]|uniref:helix-turn-helix domain-containing protein n=1 Tax=Nocardia TaxID=1817 RepID=UPI001D14D01D|nr:MULTISPECIES: helix-turn-helix transcriptional regulator [Nocardia]MCC3311400.1 helix-turn-helix transcriptional regulator [Nocardia africana]